MESESFIEMPDPNAGDYEPTDKEIEDYAEWLGADKKTDQDLFWIAREALKAKLPPGWKLYQYKDGSGDPFYFNNDTGESLWDHPLDAHYKQLFAEEKRKKMAKRSQTSSAPKSLLNSFQKPTLQPIQSLQSSQSNLMREKNDAEMQVRVEIEAIKRKAKAEQDNIIAQNRLELEAITREHKQRKDELNERYQREEKEYQEKLRDFEEKTTTLKQEYSEAVFKYSKLLNDATNDYNKKKKNAKEEFDEEIEEMKKKHEEEIAKIKRSNESEIEKAKNKSKSFRVDNSDDYSEENITNEHKSKIEELKKSFQEEIDKLKKQQREEVDRMKKQNSEEIERIKDKHKEDVERIKREQEDQVEILKTPNVLHIDDSDSDSFSVGKSITLDVTDASLLHDIEEKNKRAEEEYAYELDEKKRDLDRKHKEEITKMKDDHKEEIAQLKEDHEKEIKNLKEDNDNELSELKEEHRKDIEKEKERFEKEKKEVVEKGNKEIESIKQDQEEEIEELNEDFNAKKEELKDQFENEIMKMKRSQQRKHSRSKTRSIEEEEEESYSSGLSSPRRSRDSGVKRELEALREQYNNAIATQEQQKVQIEQSATNFRLQLELQQAKFDVEKQQIEIAHQKEIESVKQNSTSPPPSPTTTAWLRFASFQQFQRPPSSSSNKLKTSKVFSYSMKYVPNLIFANYNIFSINPAFNHTANIGVKPINTFANTYQQQPFSRMAEFTMVPPAPQTARPVGEYATGLNEKMLRQMKSQQSKLEKVREKFSSNYDQLSSSMKEAIADVYNLISGYKNVIAEQNKSLSQLATEFQQQTLKMVRSFRESLNDMENSYRVAMANVVVSPAYEYTSPRSSRRQNKIQITTPSTDFGSEDSGEEAIRNFLIWRKQQKSLRRRQRNDQMY